MMWRLKDLPKYSCADTLVDAKQFNAVRLALRRLSDNLSFPIKGKGMGHLQVIIDNDSWVVIDNVQNGLPIVAWTEFHTSDRALHEPVRCQLSYYHFGAAFVAKEAMAALNRYLGIKLERESKKAIVRTTAPTAIENASRLKAVEKA